MKGTMDPQTQQTIQHIKDKLGFSRFLHKRALVILFIVVGGILYILFNILIFTRGKLHFAWPKFSLRKTNAQPTPTPPFGLPQSYYPNAKPKTFVSNVSGTVESMSLVSMVLKMDANTLVTTPKAKPDTTAAPPPIGLIEVTVRIDAGTKLSRKPESTNKTKPSLGEVKNGSIVWFTGTSEKDTPTTFAASELILP
jgi:hypothetical protein